MPGPYVKKKREMKAEKIIPIISRIVNETSFSRKSLAGVIGVAASTIYSIYRLPKNVSLEMYEKIETRLESIFSDLFER